MNKDVGLLLVRHFWAIACLVAVLNAAVCYHRSRRYIREKPELAPGYRKLIWGYLAVNSIWLVVGLGVLSGYLSSVLDLLQPSVTNPFVMVFYGIVVVLWIVAFRWVVLGSGAQFLADHPCLFRGRPGPGIIKALTCLCIGAGMVAMIFIWSGKVPVFPMQFMQGR